MSEKRMFSKTIVGSAKFLKLSATTQNLYFHLCLHADDDGVVEAYTVMNLIRADEDDLIVLSKKEFIVILDEDYVSYITDWRVHNTLRADRKKDTIYKKLLQELVPEVELLEKKQRSDIKSNIEVESMDCPRTAQYSVVEYSSDKSKIDKIRKDKSSISVIPSKENNLNRDIAEYKYKLGSEILTLQEYDYLIKKFSEEQVKLTIEKIINHPYWNCLNITKIEEWCKDENDRSKKQTKKCGYHKADTYNRDYDFEELEKDLLNVKIG